MIIKFIIVTISLFLLELLYLKIARAKNIKDTPNHRSAHSVTTIRGGGIIIILGLILYPIFFKATDSFYFFLIGAFIVAIVSFIDDIIMLSSKLRIAIHLIAFSLLFYSLNLFNFETYLSIIIILIIYIFSIGFINIYNFMDGINGITFLNTLSCYCVLLYLNNYYIVFTDNNLLIILILSIIVFGFFNFRNKAICFAGDIGSITIGFSLLYFALKFYLISQDISILLMFSLYLIDGGWTIFERILRKENIFEAHKRHLYQIIANDLKISHLKISFVYFILQLITNVFLIIILKNNRANLIFSLLVFLLSSIIYFYIKVNTIKKLR